MKAIQSVLSDSNETRFQSFYRNTYDANQDDESLKGCEHPQTAIDEQSEQQAEQSSADEQGWKLLSCSYGQQSSQWA